MNQGLLAVLEQNEAMLADGYDNCVIGCDYAGRAVYSIPAILRELVSEGMSPEDAQEYFEFNIAGAYVGEMTPVFAYDEWSDEAN